MKGVKNTPADAFVEKTERAEILRRFHDAKGHPRGGATTLQDIKKNELYCPGMAVEVMNWCATCDIFQKMRK